ncbi:MAG: sulfur oxidoreductase [Gammaproteobacteria bacterium]|jgi:tRNA 2-thiouridine synthesizing protein C|nr:sulfur oxidoreductase [Gammaproteobacteria bacterium]
MKKILFIQRRSPYGTGFAKEALDAILMASAFEQEISLVFTDDGVWQLKNQQDTKTLGIKNFSPTFKALELYEVKQIYVEQMALEQRGLQIEDLIIPVTVLATAELRQLIQQHDVILSF